MAQQRGRAAAAPQQQQAGRKGSRWYHEEPSSDELAEWFKTVRLHEGMKHEDYVDGIVLIPQKDEPPVINGSKMEKGPARITYVPYPKVETREVYFWDLCELRGWLGALDPAPVPRVHHAGGEANFYNGNLPPGYFRQPVKRPDGKVVPLLGCSYRCAMTVPDVRTGGDGRPVRRPAQGTKVVELVNRWGDVDLNAFMKAETGAIGRSLGAAGMLVIPGSGIATAEDMVDAGNVPGVGGDEGAPAAALPTEAAAEQQPALEHAEGVRARLEAEKPTEYEAVVQWAKERHDVDLTKLSDVNDQVLRGIVRRMERDLT